jgi:hypothetical protein
MCRPHCWQYAKPTGVDVPHRGHVIIPPPDGRAGATTTGGGTIAGADGGAIIGAPPSGAPIMGAPPSIAGDPGVVWPKLVPHERQNFIPGGFSPRHTVQITGNPDAATGVCARALPQLRQNDDPGGLSWPQTEQRINTLCQ